MKSFRTQVGILPAPKKITHLTPVFLTGSCFVENIGDRLIEGKFPVMVNPFGILFNPASIAKSLEFILEKRVFREEDLFSHNGLWHSWNHHGKFSHRDKQTCLENINSNIAKAHEFLLTAEFLFITFGTSWVYENSETSEVVANCHKVPGGRFKRRLLSSDEIAGTFKSIIEKLRAVNSMITAGITVSPIRHLKDGFAENSLSKSILVVACHSLVQDLNFSYFPAYEVQLDDLRDYRFYAADMVHPSDQAVDYIWEKFSESWISGESLEIIKGIERIHSALRHIPLHPQSADHLQFIKSQLERVLQLEKRFPGIDFQEEKCFFASKLKQPD